MKTSTIASSRLLSAHVLCALSLFAPACAESDDALNPAELDLEAEDEAEEGARPTSSDELTTATDAGAFPGFGVDVSVVGDDVVLDWSSAGPAGNGVSVFRSEDAQALADLDGQGPAPAGVDEFTLPVGTTQFVDAGAADHDQPTPDYFYRVVVATGGADGVSTMIMKKSTAMAPGYNKMGLCMLDGPTRASDVVAQLGGSVTGVYTWDAVGQSYVGWTPADGVGTAQDYALPFGSVFAAQVDGSTPAYQSLVGTVPTSEALAVTAEEGLNWQLFPVLFDGPGSASYWVDVVGYVGMGMWNNLTQSADWYWGPGTPDVDVAPCQPYYSHQGDDACTSSADCSADSYCDFADAAACGSAAAGLCKARPIGCEFAPQGDVCGCDGQTYASACEAELAGSSVASDAACPEPDAAEPWVTGTWDWFNAHTVIFDIDGTGSASNGFTNTWSVVDEEAGLIVIDWNHGQYIDTLTLSVDGNHLSGTNQFGHPVTGDRQLAVYDAFEDFALGAPLDPAWHYLYDADGTLEYTEMSSGTAYWGYDAWHDATCTEASLFIHPVVTDTLTAHPSSLGGCNGWTTLAWEAPQDGPIDVAVEVGASDPGCTGSGVDLELRDDAGELLWAQYGSFGVTYQHEAQLNASAGERVYLRMHQGQGGTWCDSVFIDMVVTQGL